MEVRLGGIAGIAHLAQEVSHRNLLTGGHDYAALLEVGSSTLNPPQPTIT
jgi:hypothetical protein